MVQAISGLMSLTGDPDGPALPGRHLGLRRDDRAARHDRHPRRAAPPGPDRRGPARRGQPAVLRAVRAGQPHLAPTSPAGVVPYRMGNAHPSLFPYEPLPTADGELIVDRRQRRPVPQALRGRSASPSWPTTRGSRATRTARPTARSCGRCSSSGWRTRTAKDWFRELLAAGVPCGPINTIDGGCRVRRGAGPRPRRRRSARATGRSLGPQPDPLLRHPGPLRPAAAGPGRARRRVRAPGCRRTTDEEDE